MKLQYPMGVRPAVQPAVVAQKTLAMAYIVDQEWRDLYEVEKGFVRGTIFRELDFPLNCACGGRRHV